MKTYDLRDNQERIFGFEVNNFPLLSRQRAAALVASIPGAEVTRWPLRTFFSQEDDFCEFIIAGKRFVISEPYGDNSRYWIGSIEPGSRECCQELEVVRNTFANFYSWWPF